MKVERKFIGEEKLEDILVQLLNIHIDSIIRNTYSEDRASAIPLKKGVDKS